MRSIETIHDIRAALAAIRHGRNVGLVPTMGAFHEGHLELMRAAREECDIVVTSVFVNPVQFGPGEDLDTYPRDTVRDSALAEEAGVDVLFAPPVDEIYPHGYQTWVDLDQLGRGLEADARPGHFRGVATVCLKLFNVVRPDLAYFGQKDAQQAALVERMVRDLDLELEIRVLPTVRDASGLALSSRNTYLTREEREQAQALFKALDAGASGYRIGAAPDAVARTIIAGERALKPEYVEVVDLDGKLVLAAAVTIGRTRLIDNVVLEGDPT
jgi:pantoate--beta-alanine ligase